MTDDPQRPPDGEFPDDPVDIDGVEDIDDVTDLGRAEIDRLFRVLEAAITGPNNLDDAEVDTLLSALETAVVDPGRVDSEELDRMLSLFEAVLVDATEFDEIERVLSVFDAAGVSGGRNPTGRLFQLLEALGLDQLTDETDEDGPVDGYRVARLVATVIRNATSHSGQSGVRIGTELARAAATAHSPAELLDESRAIALEELERIGIDTGTDAGERRARDADDMTLPERGAALLEQSADVDYDEEYHPAYAHVLEQLAPDEARILRVLATEGPQPVVDVRDAGWLPVGSTLVAANRTMLGQKAGCRHEGRTPAYIHNLERLGLLWFSDEALEDLGRYRVLEAQPNVERAIESANRVKFVRKSVYLTPFGVEFIRELLPIDVIEGATGPLEPVDHDR